MEARKRQGRHLPAERIEARTCVLAVGGFESNRQTFVLSNDAYYFGVVPILANATAAYIPFLELSCCFKPSILSSYDSSPSPIELHKSEVRARRDFSQKALMAR